MISKFTWWLLFILWYMYLISSSCCNICSTFKETINKQVNQNEVTVTVIILNDKIYFLDESNQKYGCNSRNLGKLPNYTYFYLLSWKHCALNTPCTKENGSIQPTAKHRKYFNLQKTIFLIWPRDWRKKQTVLKHVLIG